MSTTLDLRHQARDRLLSGLSPGPLTASVIATWRGRMINEYGSSYVFDGLAVQLQALEQIAEAEEARVFAAEEREHGVMCGAVAESVGGVAFAEVAPTRHIPVHADTTPRAAAIRNVISICCVAETIAVALIGAERLEMPEGPLRELLSRIWSDEIGHARFGWRYLARMLPALEPHEVEAISRYLPVAFAGVEAHELAHIPITNTWAAEAATYGLCDGNDARILVYETFTEVIVPKLEALGLPARHAWHERIRR
jgi:hypothetical protein